MSNEAYRFFQMSEFSDEIVKLLLCFLWVDGFILQTEMFRATVTMCFSQFVMEISLKTFFLTIVHHTRISTVVDFRCMLNCLVS